MGKALASPKETCSDDFDDLEGGNGGENRGMLWPERVENPKLRWAFIRKVYLILCLQLLVTSLLASAFYFSQPIKQALLKSFFGALITVFSVCMVTLALCGLMLYFRRKHPWNLVFMGLFTLANGVMIGLVCAVQQGITLLEAAALMAVVTVALTLYTFWAARRGQEFSFLGPFLFSFLLVLIAFYLIMVTFPMGSMVELINGAIGAICFSLFIIVDTFNLMNRHDYDDYLEAACAPYLDVLNLFLAVLRIRTNDISKKKLP